MVPLRQLAVLHRYNPRTVTEQAAALIPDYYRLEKNKDQSETYPRDRSVYVYYEIYNLQRNAFGQTRYRVAYTIRSQEKKTLGTLVSQLVKTITKGDKEKIAIDFEQVGSRSSEATYIALDLTACGLGRHTVSVEITDLESGEKTVKEATFVVAN